MQGWFDDFLEEAPTTGGLRSIKRDMLDQFIATVMDAEQASRYYLAFMRGEIADATLDRELVGCIVEHGMTKEQIEAAFPPCPAFPGQSDLSFNRRSLVATIVWREWQRVGQRRPKGNIRHFWYTHLMYTLTRVMKDTNISSIMTCFNEVLKLLVRHEGFRYADLNFVSTKSKLCEAIFSDSPYPNIILACEKESYHEYLKPLAHVFHLTYISLGGQGSYGAFEDLVFQFIDAGIDIDQEFRILAITDYDPHGYKIQKAAKDHLERAGIRRVTLERVYLNPEHITEGIIERFAVPYEVEKSKASTTKAACTLYNEWRAENGGIYKRGGTLVQFPRNGDGLYNVPRLTDGPGDYTLYRVELDNFREDVLVQLMIDALERIIDGAEYYYAAAKTFWRETIKEGVVHAARTLIQRATRAKTQPVERRLRELRDRLNERWGELTAEEQSLIERIREDYDSEYESIQEDIDELQEQINELSERQERLSHQQWDIRETSDDMIAFVRAVQGAIVPDIPAAQELLQPVDAQLRAYGEAQEEAQTDQVVNQFTVEPAETAIRGMVNGQAHANTVFERARAGAETFTAELDYQQQRRITSAAEDDLEGQQASMSVDVPDLPAETVDDIAQRVSDANGLLAQADRTGELSDEWQTLRTQLIDHYINDNTDWDPWDDWDNEGWRR